MMPEIGQLMLILALVLSVAQVIVPTLGVYFESSGYMNLSRRLAYAQIFAVGSSFLILMLAFVGDDFSVRYVAENSNTALPFIYKLGATWGAHEGSFLLWVFILSA